MKRFTALGLLSFLLVPFAHAVSCGTLAAPTTCTLTTQGRIYTLTDFTLIASNATGGAVAYTAADISIDLATGGGGSALVTFDRVGSNGVFFVNAGETRGFTVRYDVTVAAVNSGAVAISSPFVVNIPGVSTAGNGFGAVQMTPTFNLNGFTCLATQASHSANCVIPSGQPRTFTVGSALNQTGGTGNVSFTQFTNLLTTEFIPTPGIDVDGNGTAQALTDGLLIVRYILGLRGNALIAGATGAPGATRTTSAAIESYLQSITP